MSKEIIIAMCLGIALSASCGFRVFVPLLVTSVASHFQWLPVQANFEWLGSVPAMITFGSASILEIGAYYIPVVDHVLDFIATPLSLCAGALLATNFIPLDDPMLKWVTGIVVGAGGAGAIQAGTVVTRLLSGKMSLTAANPLVSTGENVAAVGTSVLSLMIPVVIAVIVMVVMIVVLGRLFKYYKKRPANNIE